MLTPPSSFHYLPPQAKRVADRLADKKIKLELSDSAVKRLAMEGYDPVYGARPVKRAVQRELETSIAKALLRGEFEEEDTIVVEADAGSMGLVLRKGPKARGMAAAGKEATSARR